MSAFASWELARRAELAGWGLGAAFLLLVGAFFKAQVLDTERFRAQSESQRLQRILLPAPRGEIFDRNDRLIAENAPGYTIRLFADRQDSLRAAVARLDALVEDSIDVEQVVARWSRAKFEPVLVFGSGSFTTVSLLEEHRTALPGLVIQTEPRRRYPTGPAVAHLVGYVSEVSDKELESGTFPGAQQGDIVGKNGLEVEYDSLLRGRKGVRYVEVTAKRVAIRDQGPQAFVAPVIGTSIRTTIDLPLQQFIDSMWRAAMPEKRGAMVAMTPQGEILAYASFPSYDPNDFVGGIDVGTYRTLADDPARPLYDRVIQANYPPASPWKLATSAMALRRGLVTMDTRMRVPCTGGYQFGNRTFRCWKRDGGGHGSLTLAGAIATSCDVYFYQLGQMIGKDAFLADGESMGFSARSGIDLERERAAGFPGVKGYINSRGASFWSNGEILNLAIGQGRNIQTLINMTSFYAALASDGVKRAPHLFKARPGAKEWDLGLTPAQLRDLRGAMSDVVNLGTAAASGGKALEVAGKTGTGQMSGQKDLGWFIGFAPASAPKIVVGIVVEEGLHGSTVAPYVVQAIGAYLKQPVGNARVPVTEDTTRALADTVDVQPLRPAGTPARRGGRR